MNNVNSNNSNSNNNGGGGGGGAAAAAPNVRMARKKTSKVRNIFRAKARDPKAVTMGSKNKSAGLKKTLKIKRTKLLNEGRDPKERVYKKIDYYRKEAQDIYNEGGVQSIEKAKKIVALIDKLYYRMPSAELKELVEVEIDINGLAENILETIMKILDKLQEKTKTTNIQAVDDLANLLRGMGL